MMYADPQALHLPLDKLAKSVTSAVPQRANQSGRAVGDDFRHWGGVLIPGRDYRARSPLLHVLPKSSMACCVKTTVAARR